MPNWKKLITSGSDATLNSLNIATSITASIISASSGITGSLFGTSSWAINALTASFVNTASTNAFVQGGNSFGTTALLGTNDDQNLQLETSGSVRMTISSSGNVGIGTTAPLARLHISGANSDSLLRIQSPASASIMFVTGSGNVGLGTLTPTATLEIASTGSATLGQAQIYLNATAVGRNRIDFNTNGLGIPATTTRSDGTKITLYPAISATNTDIALGVAFPAGVGEFWSSVYNSTISFSWYAAATQIMRLVGDGQLRLGAGSAALPVISAGLSGTDTNTGIYFPAADTIGLVTGGTERARITSAGSASIGTITLTPSATLHVSGANADNLFRVSSPSAANALFVSGSGRVGIGTTTPRELLHVAGGNIALDATRHIDWGSGNSRITDLGLTTGQGYPITISTFGPIGTGTSNNLTEKLRLTGSGSLGLGTTTPSARFHISGGFTDGNLMRVQSSTGAEYFFISASGNVGIGTGTPTNTLQVVGGITTTSITASIISASSGITGSLFGTSSWAVSASQALTASFLNGAFLQNGNSFGTTALLGTNDSQSLQFETSGSVRMTISSSGNVGIGTTSPTARLHVSGASADSLLLVGSPTNANILFITGSGNIGIGTTPTSPFRLDVSGSARFGSGSVGFASGLGQIHAVDRTGAYITATQTTSSIVTFMGADNNGGIVGTYSNNDFSIRNNNTDKILLQGINVGIQTAPLEWIHLSSEPVGSKYLQIDAAQASNNPPFYAPGGGNTVSRVWGNIGDDYVLGTPDYWMEIKLDGTVVLIPCYTPTP